MSEPTTGTPKGHKPACRCVVCRRRRDTMSVEELQALFAAAGDPTLPDLEGSLDDAELAPPQPSAVTNKGGGKIK